MPFKKTMDIKDRFESKIIPEPMSGCWLWTAATNRDGYGYFQAGNHRKRNNVRAHRFSYELYVSKIEPGKYVLHNCNNETCVNPAHLRVGTQKENCDDMKLSGTRVSGFNNPLSFGEDGVRKIYIDIKSKKYTMSDIAKRNGCSLSLVYKVRYNSHIMCNSFKEGH